MENETFTQNEKDKELYKVSLQAFFQNELEHDKIILTLSVAGIGFFIALFLNKIQISELMFICIIVSLIMFSITVLMVLGIFYFNKKQIVSIIKGNGKSDEIKELTWLDKFKYLPFAIAIIASMFFTLSLVYKSTGKEIKQMTEKENTQIKKLGYSEISSANNSQASKEQPQEKKGFSGISSANQGKESSGSDSGQSKKSAK
jgi:hypothetical protein